jgi:hypothetical protein
LATGPARRQGAHLPYRAFIQEGGGNPRESGCSSRATVNADRPAVNNGWLRAPNQLGQPGDIRRDPARFVHKPRQFRLVDGKRAVLGANSG